MTEKNKKAPLVILAERRPNLTLAPDEILGKSNFMKPSKHSGAAAIVQNDEIIGIFTERDLLKRVVAKGIEPNQVTLNDIMTPEPATISYDASFPEALEVITRAGVRYLPVVKGKEFMGMIDIRDLYEAVNALIKEAMEQQSSIFASMMREPYGYGGEPGAD